MEDQEVTHTHYLNIPMNDAAVYVVVEISQAQSAFS